MLQSIFQEYTALGLRVLPVEWDTIKKEPVYYPRWSEKKHRDLHSNHNGLMIETYNEYACLDFDLKNASRQSIFEEWRQILLAEQPELYAKFFIESTRNKGCHVWFKYDKLQGKTALAESEQGTEVIALYAKSPLVFTYPTPGYDIVSGSMEDIELLTDIEFTYIIGLSQFFNEYKPKYDPNKKAVTYPQGKEQLLSAFDKLLPDEYWQQLLHDINLIPIPEYRRKKDQHFEAYRRVGSESNAISAKVYYKNKRVCIFSASLNEFPNWHNRHEFPVWSLPPSFVLFYKNGRDWDKAIEQAVMIAESCGIELPEATTPLTYDYPLHCFPGNFQKSILDVCEARNLSVQFVATAGLWTVSSLAGTRFKSQFNGEGKNILFCLLVGPVSVGKTPAFKAMCETPLAEAYHAIDQEYIEAMAAYEAELDKEKRPKRPKRFIPIAVDGTTEGYIHKSMTQPNGIGVYQDEAETIFNAGSFKSNNDAVSFFTQAFSGGRVSQIRVDETKERVVPNLNLNLLMGTQPSRLKNVFTEDRMASGFASRFLMVESDYIALNEDIDPFSEKKEMCEDWKQLVTQLFMDGYRYNHGEGNEVYISMNEEAKDVYRGYYRSLLQEANKRILSKVENYIMGTEAKMSAYFPRLLQILAIMHNHVSPTITADIVHKGWELYRYYAESTLKIIGNMHNEIETGLPKDLELLYQALPDEFVAKEARELCEKLNLSPRRFEVSVRRQDFAKLFRKVGQGKYCKL